MPLITTSDLPTMAMDPEAMSILNPQPTELPGPKLLHHLVKQTADSQAIDYLVNGSRGSLSYPELEKKAEAIAQRITHTCPPDSRTSFIVPVLIPQSPLLYITLLGILKAGGAFCPLNIDAPPERVKFILKDVEAKVVLVSEEMSSRIPQDAGVPILVLDQDEHKQDQPRALHRSVTGDDLAYVMYTSGSTGTPKGVGLSHRAATQALLAHDRHIPTFKRFLQFAAPTFDVFVFEAFFPLFRGSTLVSVRREELLDDLPGALREMDVDACELTPTVAGSLLKQRSNAPGLKLLLTIGEMLSTPLIKEFGGDGTKESILWGMYGPTEATIHCTLQPAFSSASSTGHIGFPLDTVSCFVIQPADSSATAQSFDILPIGEIGELAVGGHQLAVGYLNRPDQTSGAFISTPYGRVYRTGDKARISSDGTLECLGRLSEGQVKLRGQRIELGEVEEAILRTDGCDSAVAAVVDSVLVAFCATQASTTEDEILANCRKWLPRFMVPGEVILKTKFPQLPSGKVDRKRLRAEFQQQKEELLVESATSELLSDKQTQVLEVVSQVLGHDAKLQSGLASIGVDSLTSIRLASALRERGFEIETSRLFSLRTVEELCSNLRTISALPGGDNTTVSMFGDLDSLMEYGPELRAHHNRIIDLLPCTPLQSTMLSETARDSRLYCNELEFEAAPGISTHQLAQAIAQLTADHEIFRSGFFRSQKGFVSCVFDELDNNAVQIVTRFNRDFYMETAEDFLRPLRIQLKEPVSEHEGVRVLVLIHHALYDGWSMDMILQDLTMILKGDAPATRPSFRELISFQQTTQKREADDLAAKFWSEYLLDWNKQPLPKLNSRAQVPNEHLTIKDCLHVNPEEVTRILGDLKFSTQSLFQAAVVLVWSGILGSTDVTVGTVTSGRNIAVNGIDKIIGPCVASLPIRVDVADMTNGIDLLASINSSNRAIMAHSTLSISEIQRSIGSNSPLYDVLFAYQESLESRGKSARLLQEISHLDRLESKLLVEVEPADNHFTVQLTYHSDVFPDSVTQLILQQFKLAVLGLLRSPQNTQRDLRAAMGGQPSIYNPTPKDYKEALDLGKLFEAVVSKSPDSAAIHFADSLADTGTSLNVVTYAELNGMANQIAHFIQSQGVNTGQVVAVLMEKSVQLYAAILGIVKAGCGYLPISPSTPESRVREILSQAAVTHCLTDDSSFHIAGNIKDLNPQNLTKTKLESLSRENPDVGVDLARLAYVIYTSGTTGVPKGVAVTQLNIVSNIKDLQTIYPRSQSDTPRLLQACSQAFDVSVFEIFFTWLSGMCLCAARNDDLFQDLEHAVRELQITHLSLTPTVASLIDRKQVPTVEFLVTAGEPMTQSVLDNWGDILWQGYGPSETTNICTVKRMKAGERIEHLGWVFRNTSVLVVSPDDMEPVPLGWVGEFCFGGDQVAHGYLNLPQVTAEKFVTHSQFGRIYRSGDMGRMLPDGSLVILGRMDGQIKLRGQRIETGEIDSHMTKTTDMVKAAVTMLVQSQDGLSEQLATFYVPSKQPESNAIVTLPVEPTTHQHLFAMLQARLPSYMVPTYLLPVVSIPLTSSGKIDRRKLNDVFRGMPQSYLEASSNVSVGQGDDASWSSSETEVANVIASALACNNSQIGRWTPFASLGLDSLSAINVSKEFASQGLRIPISAILQNPNVVMLSRYVGESDLKHSASSKPGHASVGSFVTDTFMNTVTKSFQSSGKDVEKILPCTPLQEAMLSGGNGIYVNKMLLRIQCAANEMQSYWNAMVERHGILRTCFVTTDAKDHPFVQAVLKTWTINWGDFDASHSTLEVAMNRHLESLPDPVDSYEPPLSLAFIHEGDSIFFSFICHHALYDGVAMERLLQEIEYLASKQSLPPTVPYEPFLAEMARLPQGMDDFWASHFAGFHSQFGLPAAPGGRAEQHTHTASLELQLDEVQKQTRKLGVSLLALCQVTWAKVVAIYQKSEDVCFGNVVSGRTVDVEGIERLVAPCFNTIPVRFDMSLVSQDLGLLRYAHQMNSDMLAYQFTPFRMIQKRVQRQRARLFDSLLLLQQPSSKRDESLWILEKDAGDMDIPIVCEVVPSIQDNDLTVKLHCTNGVIPVEAAHEISALFKHFFKRHVCFPKSHFTNKTVPPFQLHSLPGLVKLQEQGEEGNQAAGGAEDWTEAEMTVRVLLSELSGVPQTKISRQTSIFRLGLDSINAVQIASRLRKQGHPISAADIIELSSCANIANKMQHIEAERQLKPMSYELERFSTEVSWQVRQKTTDQNHFEAILPCTPMQCAMLASFVQSDGQNYLNSMSYEMDHGISLEKLLDALQVLSSKHPMLRTGFVPVQHKGSSYAMVRYQPDSFKAFISVLGDDGSCAVAEWEKTSRAACLETLNQPPWKVAFMTRDNRLTMRLLIHHALYDAESLARILDSLSTILSGGELEAFEDVERGLAAILSRVSTKQEDARSFWTKHANNAVINKFPVMTPLREETRTVMTEEIESSLSSSEMQDLVQKLEVPIQVALQAAWTRVLSSYLGESSVVFGVTLSGRTTTETQNTSVPCINTIPIIARNVPSNRELIKLSMDYYANVNKFQFTPLSQVQKWLGHPASAIFDTLLAYQKSSAAAGPSSPWRLIEDKPEVEYPVSLEVLPDADGKLELRLTFLSTVLPKRQAQMLLQQFDKILQHVLCRPDESEDDLYRVEPSLFSITPAASPVLPAPVQYMHEFVERGASENPRKVALEFVYGFKGEHPICRSWTYSELDAIGNRVANLLIGKVMPETIIAIHFDKCPEAYFSILGILKAGCSFVALDAKAPKARKEFIVQDSDAPCLLTNDPDSLDFDVPGEVIHIRDSLLRDFPDTKPDLGTSITPDSTCYCLYTSGTTGTPKGCEITHDNAVQAMMAFQELFRGHWDKDSRCLQFAALHFDVSVLEQYWSWAVGITVVSATKDLILDDLTASIRRLNITHIDLTPSLARLVHPDDVPSLCRGVFITGGEQLKQEILDVWGPKAVIYNAYGPTEATIGVTTYQRVPINGRPSNIGKQFLNVGSYIFKPGTEIPVLRGGIGELCVSGKLVGKGYLKRPELTEERFPTLAEFGERIYRTGDVVRILHDGCFDFLGRADDQVKLRGQRLEIGEIDHVIRSNVPEIHDVATIVARHASAGKDVLVSFVVGRENRQDELRVLPDADGLGAKAKAACRARLPSYMEPTYVLCLPYIPLSANNKAETKILRALFGDLSPEKLISYVASGKQSMKNLNHSALGTILRELGDFLGVDPEGMDESTNVFDLGLDSINVLQLSAKLRGRNLAGASPTLILRNPIVGDLVVALASASAGPRQQQSGQVREAKQLVQAASHRYRSLACKELGISASDIEYIAPCSPLQEGMVSKAVSGDTSAYFNSFTLVLKDSTYVDRLRDACHKLVSAHPILRTVFVNTTGGCVQVALKSCSDLWKELKLDPMQSLEEQLAKQKNEWVKENKSRITSPLQLLCVEYGLQKMLVINIFHALYDGNSFDLMLEDLSAHYRGATVRGTPSFFDALTHGLLWNYDHCKPFWTEHLQDWSPPQLSILSAAQSDFEPIISSRRIPLEELQHLQRKHSVTPQSVILAAWATVLEKHMISDATIGVIVSGRSIEVADAEKIVGPLFNTLPFFYRRLPNSTWSSTIAKCHDFLTSTLSIQHTPLHSIQKWCSGGKQLFNTLFTFQIETASDNDADALWGVEDGPTTPEYPLAFEAIQTKSGELQLTLVAQGSTTDQTKLAELLEQVNDVFAAMALETDSSISEDTADTDERSSEEAILVDKREAREDSSICDEWADSAEVVRQELADLSGFVPKDIGGRTTLLELGLDSIDVIKLSSKLRKKGLEISASLLMRNQSVEKICQAIQDQASETSQVMTSQAGEEALRNLRSKLWNHLASDCIDMEQVESVSPPTPLQESMVASMVQSDFAWYFNHDVLELSPEVDMRQLQDAWKKVVEESPILRTGFYEVKAPDLDVAYCQVVHKKLQPFHDPTSIGELSDVSDLIQEATKVARKQRGQSNLFQLRFVTCQDRRLVVVSIAHALYDGWSLGLMYEALEAAYEGINLVTTSPNAFLARSMASQTEDAKTFWAEYLAGATPTTFPKKSAQPGTGAETALYKHERSSVVSLQSVQDFCRTEGTSLQTLCQACWAIVLARETQALDVVFGAILSGRDFDSAEDLMFPTMNTVAVRCVLHGTVSSFLAYLEENMTDIRQYQAYPLRKAQLAARSGRDGLFDSLFMLQKSMGRGSENRLLTPIEGGSSADLDYPVCVEAEVLGDELKWRVACQSTRLSKEESTNLVMNLDRIMAYITANSSTSLLTWDDRGVSICGQPSFEIRDHDVDQDQSTGDVATPDSDGNAWDTTSHTIRRILSEAAGVSLEAISLSTVLFDLGLDSISAIKISTQLRKEGIQLGPRDLLRATSLQSMATLAHKNDAQAERVSSAVTWTAPEDIDMDRVLAKMSVTRKDCQVILPALPAQVYLLGVWQNTEGAVFYPEFCYAVKGTFAKDEILGAWRQVVAATPILRTCFAATKSRGVPVVQVVLRPEVAASRPDLLPFVALQVVEGEESGEVGWVTKLRIHHALYDGVSLDLLLRRFETVLGRDIVLNENEDSLDHWTRYAVHASRSSSTLSAEAQDAWARNCSVVSPWERTGSASAGPADRVSYLKRAAVQDVSGLRRCAAEWRVSFQAVFLTAYTMALWRASARQSPEPEPSPSASFDMVFGLYMANRTGSLTASIPPTYPTLRFVPLRVKHDASPGMLRDVAISIQQSITNLADEQDPRLWEDLPDSSPDGRRPQRLGSFVNFLSLPSMSDADARSSAAEGSGISGSRSDENGASSVAKRAELVALPSLDAAEDAKRSADWRLLMEEIPGRENLPRAIDVEVAVQNDGSLDMGVFGPRRSTSEEGAIELVADVAGMVEEMMTTSASASASASAIVGTDAAAVAVVDKGEQGTD
jgi:amino acid adenylation domain-containing protein